MIGVIAKLKIKVEALCGQATAAHRRVDLANERIKHIEHYLGMRRYEFPDKEKRWNFQQVKDDIRGNKRPKQVPPFFSNKAA